MAPDRRTRVFITVICYIMGCFFIVPSFLPSFAETVGTVKQDSIISDTASQLTTSGALGIDTATTPGAFSVDTSTTSGAVSADTSTTPGALDAVEMEDDESLWYRSEIPMKKEHQKLLWDYCQERELDYIDMLALISLESNFNEKCSTKKCKGYFQISTGHHKNLSKTLKTENKPLDGAININWGTAMYSWILADKRVQNLEGKEKRDAALSIYQRGSGGYDKYGLNKSYLNKYYKKRDKIAALFENEEVQERQ